MRIHDPMKQWKLSPMDLQSRVRWEAYTKAKEEMFVRTNIPEAPWYIVEGNDKKRARLNCIAHLLDQIPYEEVPHEEISAARAGVQPGLRAAGAAGRAVRAEPVLIRRPCAPGRADQTSFQYEIRGCPRADKWLSICLIWIKRFSFINWKRSTARAGRCTCGPQTADRSGLASPA